MTADEASLIDTADLVSLLYTGLTGRWPGEDLPGVASARRLADGSLPAPSELVSGVPGDLDALCRIVHGAGADLSAAPHTPGELARQLSPWSPDIVRAPAPGSSRRRASPPRTTARPRRGRARGGGGGRGRGDRRPPDEGAGERPHRAGAPPLLPHPRRPRSLRHRCRPLLRRGRPGRCRRLTRGRCRAAAGAADPGRPPRGGAGPRRDEPSSLGGFAATEDQDGLDEERATGLQSAAVLLIILAIVAAAALLGWGVMRSIGGGDDVADGPTPGANAPADPAGDTGAATAGTDDESTTAAGGTGAPGTDDESAQTAPAPAGGASILGITSFDPEGDGDERNDLTPLAVDGDPETAWTSHTYLSEGWGSLKSGTGLILDLGEGASVSEVEVQLGEGTMGTRLYVSDTASRDGATELAADEAAEGTWTVTPESPASGRYLILWFDTGPARTRARSSACARSRCADRGRGRASDDGGPGRGRRPQLAAPSPGGGRRGVRGDLPPAP